MTIDTRVNTSATKTVDDHQKPAELNTSWLKDVPLSHLVGTALDPSPAGTTGAFSTQGMSMDAATLDAYRELLLNPKSASDKVNATSAPGKKS